MARRAARRLAETPEWLRETPEEAAALRLRLLKRHQKALGRCFIKPPPKRRGPRGGVLDFDYEEYLTKLQDRKAADPEEWQRKQRQKREESHAYWDRYKFQHDLDRANEAMAEDRVAESRLHEIWNAIVIDEMNLKWLSEQPLHVVIKKAPRIRGCGAAAKRAGFAG